MNCSLEAVRLGHKELAISPYFQPICILMLPHPLRLRIVLNHAQFYYCIAAAVKFVNA